MRGGAWRPVGVGLVWLLGLLLCPAAGAQPVADAIRAALAAPDTALQVPELTGALYAGRDYQPLWTGARAAAAQRALAGAQAHGLRPTDYHIPAIERLGADPAAQAQRDLLLSDGLLLLGSHVRSGAVETGSVTLRRQPLLLDADLPGHLQQAATAADFLAGLTSSLAGYPRLQEALTRYRGIAAAGGWPSLPDGPTLRAGDRAPAVAVLRARLAREGVDGAPPERADTEFDPALALAVQAFQQRHGLDADGAVGPRTRRALDTPASSRVAQLVANLERRRWLGQAPGKRQVRVNTAAFTLDAIDGTQVALHMRVVVGQPFRPTPEFAARIRYLVLNPYWEVPPSLAVEDKLPLIRRDPGYLAREHIRVLQGWGPTPLQIDPASVDWHRVGSVFPYRLRQDPGPWNALGRVKFMFPNAHNVYLHDTPARALFGQAERSFSSGCVRLQNAPALAEWILAGHPRWTPQALREALASQDTRTVHLPEPVPVYLLYWTAWVGADGAAQFRRDIYDRDGPLAAVLSAEHGP